MGIFVSAGNVEKTGSYERVAAGVYPARCFQIIDMGTHDVEWEGKVKKVHKIQLGWEISDEFMQDGRPFMVSKEYTMSLSERSGLYKDLISWRGKPFTPAELAKFDMANILEKCCQVNVTKELSKAGKEFNKVISIMPLGKGQKCMDLVNETVYFSIDQLGTPEFDKVKGYTKTKILESYEAKAWTPNDTIDTSDLGTEDIDPDAFY